MGSYPSVPWPDKTSQPKRDVKIKYDFAVGQAEVTGPQWLACVRAGGCTNDIAYVIDPNLRAPVQFIKLQDAHDYVAWLSRSTGERYRLPSEAEWEYVVRGGSDNTYPWGEPMNDTPAVCWGCKGPYDGSVTKAAAPIERFAPNKFRVFDMAGNGSELVEECWFGDYTDAPSDGRPRIADGCMQRVIRGGSFLDPILSLRVFARQPTQATDRSQSVGFRVVRELMN